MSKNDTDQKSSCLICLKVEQHTARSTRNAKRDYWICCDCCGCWFHASCGGYTNKQYNKIQKEDSWVKCIVCFLQQIQEIEQESDSSNSLLRQLNDVLVKSPAERTANPRKVKSQQLTTVKENQYLEITR